MNKVLIFLPAAGRLVLLHQGKSTKALHEARTINLVGVLPEKVHQNGITPY